MGDFGSLDGHFAMIVESLWVYEVPFSKNIHFPPQILTILYSTRGNCGLLWVTFGSILARRADMCLHVLRNVQTRVCSSGEGPSPPLKARRTSPPASQSPYSTFTIPFSYPSPPSPPSPHHHRHCHPFCCRFVLPDLPKRRKSIPKPIKNGPGTLPEKTLKIRRQKRLNILGIYASQT